MQPIGRYKILSELGQGAFAVAYKAKDTTLDRIVALKILHQQVWQQSPEAIARFEREARVAANMIHPHIAWVWDVGQAENGNPFLVARYIDGLSLDKQIDSLSGIVIKRQPGSKRMERRKYGATQSC